MKTPVLLLGLAALGAVLLASPLLDNSSLAARKPNSAIGLKPPPLPPPPPYDAITIAPTVLPAELNAPYRPGPPETGGALNATPEQAAVFAWQEFIALNWPAVPQNGGNGQRERAATNCAFSDPKCTGPLVWETMRGKVETFPGNGNPPGYVNDPSLSYGYDATPVYHYGNTPVPACDMAQADDQTPWVNLDETDQIDLNDMHAGVVRAASSPGNSAPTLIRFLAKSNRVQYTYVAARSSNPMLPNDKWWHAIPAAVDAATRAYLAANHKSPDAGSTDMVSQPNGTIEIKAGWRPLNPDEVSSHRFHTQMVRFYEGTAAHPCYRDQSWGLVALHIIQKTPSAPYFIYATFEQADNILTAGGARVEDADGNVIEPVANPTTPQVCLLDPRPSGGSPDTPSKSGSGVTTNVNAPTACRAVTQPLCATPGSRLYYVNKKGDPPLSNNEPLDGKICVDKRENATPDYAVRANIYAHQAMRDYLRRRLIANSPWPFYKLVNVQYYPFNKPAAMLGQVYTASPPYSATNPAASSYYQANIVVETNRSLQLFSGGLSPNISTDWNMDGSPHTNTIAVGNPHDFNMGGCMGCHGSQGQTPPNQRTGDFSVILARGAVHAPQVPDVEQASRSNEANHW